MNGEARDLRQLSMRIEQLVRESRCSSIAWEQTRALCDYLTLRARVMELEYERDELRATASIEGFGDAPDR
jgi:hypothetical protein